MTDADTIKQAWQAQAVAPPPAPDEVSRGAERFDRQISRRKRREFVVCLVVSLFFAFIALTDSNQVRRLAAVLVILGTAIVAWQLHRRAPAVQLAEEAGLPLVSHQRAQLTCQCDSLASAAGWYLLPMLPGLVLFAAAPVVEAGPPFQPTAWDLANLGFIFSVFTGFWWRSRKASRRLQAEIDALDTLATEGDLR